MLVINYLNNEEGGQIMKEAIRFYGGVHRDFWWLNFTVIVLLIITSVYWFVVPFYIVNYGAFEPNVWMRLLLALFICVAPAIVVTLHCWIISFVAARKWMSKTKIVGKSMLRWWLIFQSFTLSIAIGFTAIILCLFFIVDFFRYLL